MARLRPNSLWGTVCMHPYICRTAKALIRYPLAFTKQLKRREPYACSAAVVLTTLLQQLFTRFLEINKLFLLLSMFLQALHAIQSLNGAELGGRRILVREDREDRDIKQADGVAEAPRAPRAGRGSSRGASNGGRGAGRGRGAPAAAAAATADGTGESSGLQVSTSHAECWAKCIATVVGTQFHCCTHTLFVLCWAFSAWRLQFILPCVSLSSSYLHQFELTGTHMIASLRSSTWFALQRIARQKHSSRLAISRSGQVHTNSWCMLLFYLQIVVQGIPWAYTWRELKDMFAETNNVERADVVTGYDGRSRVRVC